MYARGEEVGTSKLCAFDVWLIRHEFETGQYTCRGLARATGLHSSTVDAIIQRRTWAWLPQTPDPPRK